MFCKGKRCYLKLFELLISESLYFISQNNNQTYYQKQNSVMSSNILRLATIYSYIFQSIFYFPYFQYLLSSIIMDPMKLFVFGLLLIASIISSAIARPRTNILRIRRSPQDPLSPWCNSPFLNFARFKPRFCPPNPLCKLTLGRGERDCS